MYFNVLTLVAFLFIGKKHLARLYELNLLKNKNARRYSSGVIIITIINY